MTLKEIAVVLQADFAGKNPNLNKQVKMICGSDLMSDVLAYVKPESLLLTSLTNIQVVRTAEMADVAAVCFLRGKRPQDGTVELATEKNIPVLFTELSMYEACGRLHRHNMPSCDDTQ